MHRIGQMRLALKYENIISGKKLKAKKRCHRARVLNSYPSRGHIWMENVSAGQF
jgi:hypothetical protein